MLGKIKKLAELSRKQAEEAKKHFVDHGCAKCHSADGVGNASLNSVGQRFEKMNLGCVDMMLALVK